MDMGATADVTFSNQSRTIWAPGADITTIDACTLLAHAKTPSQRTNHERVREWTAGEGCKIVKIPLVSKRKLVSSPLDLATWPQGPVVD